jgi:uncharacterized Zn-binding protein involved in type VI secretion
MRPVVRIGDRNSAGGVAVSGHMNITVNGRPAAKQGSPVTPHPCCGVRGCTIHCVAIAAYPGSNKVTMNNMPVLRIGDMDTCGHPRATGSLNTICG